MSTKDFLEKDYYKILGVPKDADAAAIKKAYRNLARDLHPDRNSTDKAAETRFKEVSEAYSVLSNPDKRKEYDEARSLFGSGFRVPTERAPAAAVRSTSTSVTCSAGRRPAGRWRARRRVRRTVWAAVPHNSAPARRGRRKRRHDRLHRGRRRRHGAAAHDQCLSVHSLRGDRGQGRYRSPGLPDMQRHRPHQ